MSWSFPIFLLKTIRHHHQLTFIKKTEDPKNITTYLNPDLVESICIFNMFEVSFRNPFQILN